MSHNVEVITEITVDGVPIPECPWHTSLRCDYAIPFRIDTYPQTAGAPDAFNGFLHNLRLARLRFFMATSDQTVSVENLADSASDWQLSAGGLLVLANYETGGNAIQIDNTSGSNAALQGFIAGND